MSTEIVSIGETGIQLKTLQEAREFAKEIVESGFAPKGLEKPASVLIAMQMGMELGLKPMAALQNIGVINGRPGIYGDAALALVRGSGLLEGYEEDFVGEEGKDTRGVRITVKRRGQKAASNEFTVADAKRAGLWGKAGPWTQYPKRMLMFRARGFLLRDQFGDILKGFRTVEELRDYAEDERVNNAKPADVVLPDEPEIPSIKTKAKASKPDTEHDDTLTNVERLLKLLKAQGVKYDDAATFAASTGMELDSEKDAGTILASWETFVEGVKLGPVNE